ncbi:hypothetical protein EYR40_004555 [Pleurotus pulmonarius]|nr:hypothetical protein EYR38_001786 [Pleurotus pulmonarius]KAF4605765.1 hypothetical protein EYR40_004555 [Pleurotus pulmonarius]
MGAVSSSGRSPVSEVAEAGGGEAAVIDAPVDRRAALGGGEVVESSNGGVVEAAPRKGLIGHAPPRRGGAILEMLSIALNGLKNAGAMTHALYMKEAAGVLLQVVNTIQDVRDNQDAFLILVCHAGGILLSVNRKLRPPREITDDMKSTLERIKSIIDTIQEISSEQTKRGRFRRFFYAAPDKVLIRMLREELNIAVAIFGVDVAITNNADINELTRCVRQLMNEDHRVSRAGAADGPSGDPPSVAPPPLSTLSSHESPTLPSVQVSDVNIHIRDGVSGDIDGSNEGQGTQSISASGIDGDMDSPVASHSTSRPRGSRMSRGSRGSSRSPSPSYIPSTDHLRRTTRASSSPSVEDDDHSQTLEDPPPLSGPRRSSPAPPRANPQSTSFSGIKINNGAFNCVNSPCNVTNKGSGTQTFYGSNIATNVGGDVMMNCGNVTTITTSNSNNDYSRRYYGSRSSELEFTL